MKKIILIFIFLINCTAYNAFAQTPNWIWAKAGSGTGGDEGSNIASDAAGNVYITGYFNSSTLTLGTYTLSSAGSYDVFLAKYNPNGTVLWATNAGGINDDEGSSVAIDDLGNVYLSGFFSSSQIIFGTDTLLNTGAQNVFLTKYNSSGTVLWAKSIIGTGGADANSIATDPSGNVFVTGFYDSTIIIGSYTLTCASTFGFNVFLAKYDPFGTALWAKSSTGTKNEEGTIVTTDGNGNAYISGMFVSPSTNFGTCTLTNPYPGTSKFFIAKYDPLGVVLWAKSAGGTNSEWGYGLTTDAAGNIYATGSFKSSSLILGTYTLTNKGNTDIFFVKYNSVGTVVWAQNIAGTGSDEGASLTTDPFNNIYMSGRFTSPSIAIGIDTLHFPLGGFDPMFIAEFDTMGTLHCSSALTSGGDDQNGIAIDGYGNAYISGDFAGGSFIIGNDTLPLKGSENIFIAKFNCNGTTSINGYTNKEEINVWPNPANNNITIQSSEELGMITICNSLGEMVLQIKSKNTQEEIDINKLSAGIYILQMQGRYKKFIKE